MTKVSDIYTLSFPNAKSMLVSGDIHGGFNQLVHKLCVQYAMRDTLLIVAGDCGFGFDNPGYYDEMVKKNSRRMSEANNSVPIHLKVTLSIKEANKLTGIGINSIEDCLREPNCPFVLFVGTKKMIKRKEFEEYISKTLIF